MIWSTSFVITTKLRLASDLVANSMPTLGKENGQQRYDNFCPLVTPEMASIRNDKQDMYMSGPAASVNADQPEGHVSFAPCCYCKAPCCLEDAKMMGRGDWQV